MTVRERSYRYVGPVGLKAAVRPGSGGCRIGSATDFDSRAAERSAAELAEPFTFVVGTDGPPRVGQHDLARLLLMFRSLVRKQEPGSWDHMRDYDLSFERLADAVDAAAELVI
ncbi:hypothetical protein [Streptomyces incanus]